MSKVVVLSTSLRPREIAGNPKLQAAYELGKKV